ncbi:hypothetical protein F3J44_21090 [Pantoea sp. Tr-811]|uniref:DUF6680 family protein n=1 Tax=Pantoea sp. Tr-811 TaxID=2608361 RepID=UPI00142419B5|nr:DUF6680 family protein [Pantoea sp. Tr-811]NIF28864.1 hypothetical protein [Pantoea sp. Tr-811]
MEPAFWIGVGTVFAALVGPILAVQTQKYLERRQSQRDQKMRIFSILMSTRATRLSPMHVEALNMIDLAFAGGARSRSSTETEVLEAWRDHLDHLNSTFNEHTLGRWSEKQDENLTALLGAMAADLGLRYDRILLRNGAYIPKGLADMESEQHQLRQLALKVLSGDQPVSMRVTEFPSDPDFAQSQVNLQEGLARVLSGQTTVGVHLEKAPKRPDTDASASRE